MEGCKHKYVFIETIKKEEKSRWSFVKIIKKLDRFFCEKCLEEETVLHIATISKFEQHPDWR